MNNLGDVRTHHESPDRDSVHSWRKISALHNHLQPDKGYSRLRLLLIALDLTGAFSAWILAIQIAGTGLNRVDIGRAASTAAVFSVLTVTLLWANRLYQARVCAVRTVEVSRIGGTVVLTCLAAASVHRFDGLGSSLDIGEVAGALSMLFLLSLRFAYSSWLRTCHVRGLYCRPVCVIGDNDEAQTLVELLTGQPELGYHVVAVLGDPEEWALRDCPAPGDCPVPAVDPGPDVVGAVRHAGASGVVIAVSAVEPQHLEPLLRHLVANGLHVQMSTGLARIGHRRMRPSPVSHQLLYYVEYPNLSIWQRRVKRTIDLVGASFALLSSAPLLLAAAVAVKINDGGPVLYRQERIGYNGKPFQVIKIRTMVPDASSRQAELLDSNERAGPLFKLGHDPRVTRVGRVLRAASIDELPQLVNVIRGEMSLVGPRPALPEEVVQFDVELLERASVPPGITGLWQISARDNPSFNAYRRLDLFYVDNWSVMMDISVLCSTVAVVAGRAFRSLRGGSEMAGSNPAPVAVGDNQAACDPSLT